MHKSKFLNPAIPLLLFAVSCFYLLSQPNSTGFRLNNLVQPLDNSTSEQVGEWLRFSFKANFRNLGVTQVVVNSPENITTDFVEFRIREHGSDSWYYQNRYPANQFIAKQPFPIGFPPLADSSGRFYEIELRSLSSGNVNGLTLIYNFPLATLANTNSLVGFSADKLGNILWDRDLLKQVLIAYLPLFLYIATQKLPAPAHSILFSGLVLGDILFVPINDYTLAALSLYWICSSFVFKKNSSTSVKISFALFALSLFFTLNRFSLTGEKSAIWSFITLAIAILLSLKELPSKKTLFRYDN